MPVQFVLFQQKLFINVLQAETGLNVPLCIYSFREDILKL
jgi:hypothetical protein